MQINSLGQQPTFNANLKFSNAIVYDLKSKKFVGDVNNLVLDTKKISSVVEKVNGLNPAFTEGIRTFLISNDSNKIYGISSLKSYDEVKNLINEYSKDEHKYEMFQLV